MFIFYDTIILDVRGDYMKKIKATFRLEICDFRYKENETKIHVQGWAHYDNYKVIIKKKNSKKIFSSFSGTELKYDVCLFFDEEIEENNYGFDNKFVVNGHIKEFDIYILHDGKEKLVYKIRNNFIYNFKEKIKKIFVMIFKAIKLFWKEYHFLVPPKMIKKYFKDFKQRMGNINNKDSKCYDQNIIEEYHSWIDRYEKVVNEKIKLDDVGYIVIGKDDVTINTKKIYYLNNEKISDILNKVNTKYICFLTDDCVLNDNFYYYIKESIQENKDFIYGDSDLIVDGVRQKPLFKPDWSPDTIMGANYIGDLFVVKTDIVKKKINDKLKINIYNYILNTVFDCGSVYHISDIIYHNKNRIINQDEIYEIVKDFRKDIDVLKNKDKETVTVTYKITSEPLISIVIPTKDASNMLDTCLKSIYDKTTYKNYEVIVIDNNSSASKTFELFDKYKKEYKNFRVERLECAFNYSYINNTAVKKYTKGKYIVLLNNDTEIVTENWLEIMLGYAMQKHIGTVGCKLLFEDNTLQHAGLIMGKGGLAGHSHYGEDRYTLSNQWELKIPYDVSGNTAACIMIEKDKFLSVNGLEEKLAVAFNDVDFNLKLLKKGYNNVYLPNVVLYHYESKTRGLDSTPEKQKRFMQEWKYMMDNWKEVLESDPYYNINFSRDVDYKLDASREVYKDE